jgi:hypothetical protein
MGPRIPVSRKLAEALLGAGEALVGARALPWNVQEILLFDQAGLHDDFGIAAAGVKFVTYLESLSAARRTSCACENLEFLRVAPVAGHRCAGSDARSDRGPGSIEHGAVDLEDE